jgi:pimeloyl-ACP methyl ester carboxylesterase
MKKNIFITALFYCLMLSLQVKASGNSDNLISVEVKGKGQPLILLHGMSCTAEVWDDVVKRYSNKYELHLVSVKGFGTKENVSKEHILKSIKDELISYTKSKKLQNPIIIGHSMGGFIGLWAAAEAPDLFAKVVSVDGVPYFPVLQMPGITPETAKPIVEQMSAAFSNMDEAQTLANQRMVVSTMIANEAKRERIVEMGMQSNSAVTGQAYGEMFTTDIRPLMPQIKVPVLVFGAWAAYKSYGLTKESVTENYNNQLKSIPNVQFLLAEKAYHFVFFDEPEWFYASLDQFLKN